MGSLGGVNTSGDHVGGQAPGLHLIKVAVETVIAAVAEVPPSRKAVHVYNVFAALLRQIAYAVPGAAVQSRLNDCRAGQVLIIAV